jgi:hypothetical protein
MDVKRPPENSGIDECFRMRDAPKLSVRGIDKARLAVTEIRYDFPNYGISDQLARKDAFLIALQLRPYRQHELWYEGK